MLSSDGDGFFLALADYQSEAASCFFDFFPGSSAGFVHLDGEFLGHITFSEQLDTVPLDPAKSTDQTGLAQALLIDNRAVVEAFIQAVEVNHSVFGAEGSIAEPALGQAAVQGHLPTFKTWFDCGTGTGLLAFVPTAGCLAVAGTFTAANAFAALGGTGGWFDVVKSHDAFSCREVLWRVADSRNYMAFFSTNFLPRILKISSGMRRAPRAARVALTTFA